MKGKRLAVFLIMLALAVRMAVPAGWMPSGEKGFALTLCAGGETSTVWIDTKGQIHKSDPSKGEGHNDAPHEPCAFAGVALAAGIPSAKTDEFTDGLPAAHAVAISSGVTIGQGLAAPPPPATGPPTLI